MGIAGKFNKGVKFNFETPKDLGYCNLKEMYETDNDPNKVHVVRALYINTKGKYGEQPLIVTDDAQVNAPSHLLEVVKEIRADASAVDAINNGKFGFTIYPYEGKNGDGFSVNWVDL